MNQAIREGAVQAFSNFHIPRYSELPDMGLYLEQTAKYTSEHLLPLGDFALTPSMISNYVKKGLISNPVKKLYSRDQLAYLFFITLEKNILSLDALSKSIRIQQQSYDLRTAYDYFCGIFENLLRFTFELEDSIQIVGEDSSEEKRLLFTSAAAAVEKIYIEYCLSRFQLEQDTPET